MYNYEEIVEHAGQAAIDILKKEYYPTLADAYVKEIEERMSILEQCSKNLVNDQICPDTVHYDYNWSCPNKDTILNNPKWKGTFTLNSIRLKDCYVETYGIPDTVEHTLHAVVVSLDIVDTFNLRGNIQPLLSTMFRIGSSSGKTIREFETESYPLCTLYKMHVSRCSYIIQWLLTYFDQMRAVVEQSLVEYVDKKFNGAVFEYKTLDNGCLKLVAVFS